jgi:hypothetical protein
MVGMWLGWFGMVWDGLRWVGMDGDEWAGVGLGWVGEDLGFPKYGFP